MMPCRAASHPQAQPLRSSCCGAVATRRLCAAQRPTLRRVARRCEANSVSPDVRVCGRVFVRQWSATRAVRCWCGLGRRDLPQIERVRRVDARGQAGGDGRDTALHNAQHETIGAIQKHLMELPDADPIPCADPLSIQLCVGRSGPLCRILLCSYCASQRVRYAVLPFSITAVPTKRTPAPWAPPVKV